jgi:hypothetical protein
VPHGYLSLPARLYLLAWDDTLGAEAVAGARPVRAGALAALAQRGLLTDEDGIATPVDLDSETGDAALDGLLELVRESRPHPWRSWVTLHARVTSDAVREQLAADGRLRAERKRVLGVFPSVEHVLESETVLHELRQETREALKGPLPVAEIPAPEATAAALAAAAKLPALPEEGDAARVTELIERSGAAGVVRELYEALAKGE